uniref:Uncharacterized protein n=1 Tax=Anguilla anguilla TaxID=7936 RepID=A0A0E9RT83_ANGAN
MSVCIYTWSSLSYRRGQRTEAKPHTVLWVGVR